VSQGAPRNQFRIGPLAQPTREGINITPTNKIAIFFIITKTSIRTDIANTSMIRRANFWELESMKATSSQMSGKKIVYFFQRVLISRNSQNRFKDCAVAVEAKSSAATRMSCEARGSASIFFSLVCTRFLKARTSFQSLVDSLIFRRFLDLMLHQREYS